MDSDCLLGIDVGTYGLKASLWSVDGELQGTARREYEVSHPQPLWAEQDPQHWWQALRTSMTDVLSLPRVAPESIKGIGVSAYVPPLVLLDKTGNVLRPAIMSFDQRSLPQARRLRQSFSKEVFESTGNRIAAGAFSATSLLWVKENEPHVFDATDKIIHATGYMVYRLTGALAMDYSNASMTLLFNTRTRRWSELLSASLEIPSEKLPHVVGAWDVVGELSTAAAQDLELKPGIPVVAGGNDSACSMLGAGVVNSGMVLESIGTSIIFAYVNDQPTFDDRVMNRCHVIPGHWINLAGMSTPGACYRWFRDQLGHVEQILAEDTNVDVYTLLDQEAAMSPPGARGLIFLPYMSGERSPIWNPNARGVLFGMTLSHTRRDVLRAILEGGAYAVRDNLHLFLDQGLPITTIRITGGGAKSPLWRQIMADVLGFPLHLTSTFETATLGAAILAGCGAQVYSDPSQAATQLVKVRAAERPRPRYRLMYATQFSLYKQIYEQLLPCYEKAQALEQ